MVVVEVVLVVVVTITKMLKRSKSLKVKSIGI